MSRQSNRARRAWSCVVVVILAAGNGTTLGRSQQVGPTPPAPALTGKWKLDTGETIDITQDADGEVTARFSPPVACWDLKRTGLFSGRPTTEGSGATATVTFEDGTFWACTRTEKMWKACGVPKLFETRFRATVDPYGITGENLRPGYWLPGGDFAKCRPDSAYEEWVSFSLTPLCRPATPWFDSGTNCQDAQRPVIASSPSALTLSMCGFEVLRLDIPDAPARDAYASGLVTELAKQIGSLVCCQAFRDAVRTGRPCNPSVDVDCDGRPNDSDLIETATTLAGTTNLSFPDINIFSTPPGAAVAPFPAGLNPDDPGFVPDSTGCDCKWQLIKGVLNCGTGGQQHSYVATWKCPTSGTERTTRKYAPASAPCP